MIDILPIQQLESENVSGCLRLRLVNVKDITFFPRMIAGVLNGQITFAPGKDWIEWKPIENTFYYEGRTSENMEGVIRSNNIKFTLPAMAVNEYMLDQLSLANVIVLITDSNLRHWVFGTPQRPMKFRYDNGSGVHGSGRAEYACFFLGKPFSHRGLYNEVTAAIMEYLMQVDGIIMEDTDGIKMIDIL
jgi:hypothetical protein